MMSRLAAMAAFSQRICARANRCIVSRWPSTSHGQNHYSRGTPSPIQLTPSSNSAINARHNFVIIFSDRPVMMALEQGTQAARGAQANHSRSGGLPRGPSLLVLQVGWVGLAILT